MEALISNLKNLQNWARLYPNKIPDALQKKGMAVGMHLSIPSPELAESVQLFAKNCNDLSKLNELKNAIMDLEQNNEIDVYISIRPLIQLIDEKLKKLSI